MGSEPVETSEVARLGRLAGILIPPEDLAPVAKALAAHRAFVEPLLRLDPAAAEGDPAGERD